MKTLQRIASDLGVLLEEKNAAYGSAFQTSGAALRLLYPAGIPASGLDDALLIARIWDKLQRIATDNDAFGESPFLDLAGYGILGAHLHQAKKENEARCDSVKDQVVAPQPSAQHASAITTTSARTTTSASAKSATPPLPQPSPRRASCCSRPDASAPPAAERVKSFLEKRRLERNWQKQCARNGCAASIAQAYAQRTIRGKDFRYCSMACLEFDLQGEL